MLLTESATSVRTAPDKEEITSQVIRLMWQTLMDGMGCNVMLLVGDLYSKGLIELNEVNYILSRNNSEDRTAELLLTVERKGWHCLVGLVEGLRKPELKPLHPLAKQIELMMEECRELHFLLRTTQIC